MQSAREEGKRMGENDAKKIFDQIAHTQAEEFKPNANDHFDPETAKEMAQRGITPQSEPVEYLKSDELRENAYEIHEDEFFLKKSEQTLESAKKGESTLYESSDYLLKTCQQRDAPYPLSINRNLHVEVAYNPGTEKQERICLGHSREKRFTKKESANNTAKKWREEFSADPFIKEFRVNVDNRGVLHKHVVKAFWTHVENVPSCNNYQTQEVVVNEPTWEEVGDTWTFEDAEWQELTKSPHCTYFEKICIDNTPSKVINGKEIKRQCWREKITFLCKLPDAEDCPFFKDANCELIRKECLEEGSYGCTLWKLIFKCYSNVYHKRVEEGELFGMDEDPDYKPNDSFSEIASKLAVFDEIKNELQETQAQDARCIQVFKGQNMECGKNIADELMYDCCFSFSGLAKELKFMQCSEEEMALSEKREQGLCHYVGSYPKKFHDLWKSRDKHVFCCFKTKLGRVLQQQAHTQLTKDWGKPDNANCQGLTIDEISRLDFSKMDFSELHSDYNGSLSEKFKEKLESFQQKVEKKVRSEASE